MKNKFLDCYYRVSTKKQKEGYSLDSQIKISEQVAKQLGLKVRPHNEYNKSSTMKGVKRDKFEEIKTLIEQGKIKNLWGVEQERIFRKPSEVFLLKEYFFDEFGVTLYLGENAEPFQFGSFSMYWGHQRGYRRIKDDFDLVVTNPPYLTDNEYNNLSKEIKLYEPQIALRGGKDGLSCFKEIAHKIRKITHLKSLCFVEIGYNQKDKCIKIFEKFNMYCHDIIVDYQNYERILIFNKKY